MKNTAIVAAVAVVVVAATPYAMGWEAERESAADLQAIVDQLPYVVVAQHSYRRGWLSSEEDITFQPAAALAPALAKAGAAAPLQFTFHNTIHHGPLPGLSGIGLATIETRLVPPAGASEATLQMLAAAPPVRTELNLFGGGRLSVKGRKLASSDLVPGWSLSSDGGEFAMTFGRHFDTLDMDASVPHIRAAQADGPSIELSGLLLKSRAHRALRSLYVGTADGTVGDFAVSVPMPGDAPRLDLGISAVQYHKDEALAGDYVNGAAVLNARVAHFAGTQVEGIKLDVAFEHWQADALERFEAGVRASNSNLAASPADKTAQIMSVMKTSGVALVAHDPVFKFNAVEFALPQGFAKLSGSVRVTGATRERLHGAGQHAGGAGQAARRIRHRDRRCAGRPVAAPETARGDGAAQGTAAGRAAAAADRPGLRHARGRQDAHENRLHRRRADAERQAVHAGRPATAAGRGARAEGQVAGPGQAASRRGELTPPAARRRS